MKTMTVYGASDDLIEVEVSTGYADEFYGYANEGNYAGYFDVLSDSGSFRIHAIYDGCWSFALGQTDEAARTYLPEHTFEVGSAPLPPYSMVLRLAVPDEFHIEPCQKWRD